MKKNVIGPPTTWQNNTVRGDTPLVVTLTEKRFFEWHEDEISVNLRSMGGSYGGGSEVFVITKMYWNGTDTVGTLSARNAGGSQRMPDKENFNAVIEEEKMAGTRVRRLTPMECERLQGFPDGWTDIGEWIDTKGKRHKPTDSPRYKALGNSIAIPTWIDILQGIAELCPEDERTLGSLFDGIGGFPLIWERLCGGKAVWASEIEEFCIAVTKRHFGEVNSDGNEETAARTDGN